MDPTFPECGRKRHRREVNASIEGGLQWYRCGTSGEFIPELQTTMQKAACSNMIGCHLIEGAGHWVQQEQPAEVSRLLAGVPEAGQRGPLIH